MGNRAVTQSKGASPWQANTTPLTIFKSTVASLDSRLPSTLPTTGCWWRWLGIPGQDTARVECRSSGADGNQDFARACCLLWMGKQIVAHGMLWYGLGPAMVAMHHMGYMSGGSKHGTKVKRVVGTHCEVCEDLSLDA